MFTRRRFALTGALSGIAALGALTSSTHAWASPPGPSAGPAESTTVHVPDTALGALASAASANLVTVSLDPALASGTMRIGDAEPIDVTTKLRLKGKDDERPRFLDDARNAARVGASIRDALSAAMPTHEAEFAAAHKAWSRPFARKALAWSRQLAKSKVAGKSLANDTPRQYLLEWAGASLDSRGQRVSAALGKALAQLPSQPASPSLAAYERYVDTLVAALV